MLKVPIRRIGGIHMQLNTDLEDLDGFLPVDVVVTNEGSHAPFRNSEVCTDDDCRNTKPSCVGTNTLPIP